MFKNSTPNVIGEGTYGCVMKPSLRCKTNHTDYTHKLSKVMLKKHALQEYKEMQQITALSGIEKYIISMPRLCEPQIDKTFMNSIAQCENEKFKKANVNDFRMLIVEDGGVSLKQFADEIIPTLDKKQLCIFFTKLHHLLEGLLFFYKHDIVHHDIKSRNIVYNIETGKIRFIDFGLMKKRSQLIRESKQNINNMAQKWENFPPEYDCANTEDFQEPVCNYGTMNHKEFLQKLSKTFDWYSFGLMMKRMLKDDLSIFERNLSKEAIEKIYNYFSQMANKDLETRPDNIQEFPNEYKQLLEKYGLWSTNTPKPSAKSIRIQKKLEKTLDISPKDRTILMQALEKRRACQEGYERNRKTQKCMKKCKPGYTRNVITNRCRRVRPQTKKKRRSKSKDSR